MIQKQSSLMRDAKSKLSYSDIAVNLHEKDLSQTINFVLSNIQRCKIDECLFSFIFRKFKPIFTTFQNSNDKKRQSVDINSFRLFSKIFHFIEIEYERFLDYMTEQTIVSIFEALETVDETQAEPLICILENTISRFRESAGLFKDMIANWIINYSETKNMTILNFCFKTLFTLVSKEYFGDDIEEYYIQYILPSILHQSLADCESLYKLIEAVCSQFTGLQLNTLKYALKYYNVVTSVQQTKIIELTAKIIHVSFFFKSETPLIWEFCAIINTSMQSDNFIIVDTAMEIFNDNAVKKFVSDNHKIIIPMLFESLYKLTKRFWKGEQRCKAVQILNTFLNLNSDLFEKCLINYNKKKTYFHSNIPSLDNEKYYIEQIKKTQNSNN